MTSIYCICIICLRGITVEQTVRLTVCYLKKATYLGEMWRLLSFILWLRISLILNTIVRITPAIDASVPRTVHNSIELFDNNLSLDFPYKHLLLREFSDDSSGKRRTAYRFGNAKYHYIRTYVCSQCVHLSNTYWSKVLQSYTFLTLRLAQSHRLY